VKLGEHMHCSDERYVRKSIMDVREVEHCGESAKFFEARKKATS
jgi:hypothetical protein